MYRSTHADTDAVGGARPGTFDVCHAGVALRAVVAVQLGVAIGVGFAARGVAHWLVLFGAGSGLALTATLSWLIATCVLRRALERAGVALQWLVAVALGAACAVLGWALLAASGFADRSLPHWGAPAAAGAAMSALLVYWLRMRGRLAQPAHAAARFAELQARIRPHFLFNTINTAMALVRVDPRRAEDLLADLAELFRVALMPGDAVVTLADEVHLARRYLEIEQARFGERVTVQWEIDEAAGRARLPPLLLQPLVENAVRHGIEPSANGGTIRICTRARPGTATIVIVNTVPPQASAPGHGMALHNVRERLALMHDVAATFDARREGAVYRVQIIVPL